MIAMGEYMKKICMVIIFLVIGYFCFNEVFVSVQTDPFSLKDMDITSAEYQELADRMLEVEEQHNKTNQVFWGEVYRSQHTKATGKKESYFYVPYVYADISDVLTKNTFDWNYHFGILSYKEHGAVFQTKIKELEVEINKDINTDILWPVVPHSMGKQPAEHVPYSMRDMEYFEEQNEYVLNLKVATWDSSIQQNALVPLTVTVMGSFEKNEGRILDGDEEFSIEFEMQYLNNVT